jgi:hypothetical protein
LQKRALAKRMDQVQQAAQSKSAILLLMPVGLPLQLYCALPLHNSAFRSGQL